MGNENIKLLILWVLYFLYMMLGAYVFMKLEYENEQHQINHFQRRIARIRTQNNVSDFVMQQLMNASREACSLGMIDPLQEHHSRWDIIGSFYFTGTVITTIGFGMTSPVTRGGQLCFLPYAFLGIPLHVLLFNTLLDRTVLFITYILRRVHRLWKSRNPKREQSINCDTDVAWEPSTRLIALVSVLALAVIILVTAPLFAFMEGWTLFEAAYFAVVAYTTVGFGDFVPSVSHSDSGKNLTVHYKIGNWIVIIIGLLFMYPAIAITASIYKQMLNGFVSKWQKCWRRNRNRNRTSESTLQQTSAPVSRASASSLRNNVDDRENRTAFVVLQKWHSLSKVSRMGTLNTVEASILKSRLSPCDDHVNNRGTSSANNTPARSRRKFLVGRRSQSSNHVTNRMTDHVELRARLTKHASLEELGLEETRLSEEYTEALNKLRKQRLSLIEESHGNTDNDGKSGVAINVEFSGTGLGNISPIPSTVYNDATSQASNANCTL